MGERRMAPIATVMATGRKNANIQFHPPPILLGITLDVGSMKV